MDYEIRSALPDDIAFIYSTWLDSYRYDSDLGKSMRNSLFYPNYQRIIDGILLTAQVLVACNPEEPNVILGYLVYEGDVLHYAFTKYSFRHLGIANSLWAKASFPSTVTHKTHLGYVWGLDKTNLVFNPLLLYRKGNQL